MRTTYLPILALLSALPLLGCSSEPNGDKVKPGGTPPPADTGSSDETPTAGPTFHKDVEPILQQHCQGCHSPGSIAPFSLLSYSDAKAVSGVMVMRTQERSMPPWGALETDECKPRYGWKHDNRLSDAELATIKAWDDAGTPEGDPKDAPSSTGVKNGYELPDIDLTVEPIKPFVTSGEKDQFRCFVMDPKLTTDQYLNGAQVIPGNSKVVHHAVVLIDPTGESVAMADADGGFDCSGGAVGAGIKNPQVLAIWVPGAPPTEYPPNVGIFAPATSKLVMQVHYHPAGTTAAPDTTKIQLRFNTTKPEYKVMFIGGGNFPKQFPNGDGLLPGPNDRGQVEFFIPANVKDHTETMKLTLTPSAFLPVIPEMRLYNAFTHMHYVGTDMLVSVDRPNPQNGEPAKECLVQTPKWDFNWQQTYVYDAPIENLPTLREGDVLNFRCIYNNTMDNPFLKRALLEEHLTAPKDIVLGENTLDEMCVSAFSALVKN
jgi:mono/diheme cytochrome c family protein